MTDFSNPCPGMNAGAAAAGLAISTMMQPESTAESHVQRQVITFKLRLRDKHAAELNRQARAVNFVWNYLNETQQKAARAKRKWLSAFDLQKLTNGASKELDIHAHTIQRVCRAYDDARKAHKKAWLKWRGRKSLGWVPFNTGHVSFDGGSFKFRGVEYQPMHSREELQAGAKIGAGSFNQDARGRWYLNVPVEVDCAASAPLSYVGIDLGLKTMATLSTGEKIEAPRLYRASEKKLATAQRARKTPNRVRNIHAKTANRRKDFLHKASAKIASEHGLIVVGDVSPKKIAKTKMAKSSLDAGWSSFKNMLSYKAIRHGGTMLEADERYTTQSCSICGALPRSRPRGIAGLRIREWACDDCGSVHDRDINADELRRQHRAHVERRERMSAASPAWPPTPSQPLPDHVLRPAPRVQMDHHVRVWRAIKNADWHDWLNVGVSAPKILISDIISVVSEHYGVPRIDIISQRRTAAVIKPRHVAVYLARVLTVQSLPEIGRRFGGRDHTTILSAYRRISGLIEHDPGFAAEVDALRLKILGGDNANA